MDYPQAVTRLGLGSVHPGGWDATLDQLAAFPLAAGSRVLEVGCGTGRTACHLARQGFRVTAIDISPAMLMKAGMRSLREGVKVDFRQADVTKLPFTSGRFDAVLAESVSIFTDTGKAVSEYFRVLRPGGRLFDREIFAAKPIPPGLSKTIGEFFGGARLLTEREWRDILRQAGFADCQLWRPTLFTQAPAYAVTSDDGIADPGSQRDPQIAAVANRYAQLMARYGSFFAYAVFMGRRANDPSPRPAARPYHRPRKG